MFTKDNILFVRYANPQNDTIYIEYGAEENVNVYYMPVLPLDSYEWQILSEADYDVEKVYVDTLEWIKNPFTFVEKKVQPQQNPLRKITVNDSADILVSWKNNFLQFDRVKKPYEAGAEFSIAVTLKNNPLVINEVVNVKFPYQTWETFKVEVDTPYFSNYSLYTFGNNLSFTLSHQK